MKIKNVSACKIDADVGFPFQDMGKADMTFDRWWLTIRLKKQIIYVPRERIKSIVVEIGKKTIVLE